MTLSEKDSRKGRKNGLGVDPVNDSFTASAKLDGKIPFNYKILKNIQIDSKSWQNNSFQRNLYAVNLISKLQTEISNPNKT